MENPIIQKNDTVYTPARGVISFRTVFVNVIMVRTGKENSEKPEWVLVDAGLKGYSKRIKRIAEKHFGTDNPPRAIILTHGHFDHIGNIKKILKFWDAPVFCHRLELPYLTGKSAYPPQDPTVDYGIMAMVSRLYPTEPIDLGGRILPLTADGTVPFMEEWTWHHVPGHSPGQIALFRESDRTLISADAFVTTKQESAYSVITQKREINGPPAYFTIDWQAAAKSVLLLEKLRPEVVISGHGRPMEGSKMRKQLRVLTHHFYDIAVPKKGRYVLQPAKADERGIISIPEPNFDPIPRVFAGVGLAMLAATTTYLLLVRKTGNKNNTVTNQGSGKAKSGGLANSFKEDKEAPVKRKGGARKNHTSATSKVKDIAAGKEKGKTKSKTSAGKAKKTK